MLFVWSVVWALWKSHSDYVYSTAAPDKAKADIMHARSIPVLVVDCMLVLIFNVRKLRAMWRIPYTTINQLLSKFVKTCQLNTMNQWVWLHIIASVLQYQNICSADLGKQLYVETTLFIMGPNWTTFIKVIRVNNAINVYIYDPY